MQNKVDLKGKKVRVVHFGAGNLFGGIEVMLVTMAKFQHEWPLLNQSFAFFFEGTVAKQLRALGFEVKIFPETKRRNIWKVLGIRGLIKSYLGQLRPDVVVVHGQWVHSIVAGVVLRLGIKLVHWSHDPPTGRIGLDWYLKLQKPDLIICNSEYTKLECASFLKSIPAKVVYCPVENLSSRKDDREIALFREKWKTKTDEIVFLHVARWEPHKGHDFLVQGAAKLLRSQKNWKIWFVGKPQRDVEERYFQGIREQIKKNALEGKISFLGWQDDLSLVLASSDVYCQPNIGPEPFGISIIEAMYSGLPVIVTPLGGPKETVEESCGIHVPPHDAGALSIAMASLSDKEKRKEMGVMGQIRALEIASPRDRLAEFYSLII